ncbi:matrixin family metalloprotease [Paenibacillus taichungensis]|uniref:matrixin family metalloprotease n=1 Tax=Paenibacillus taichungensis TaxID=484184 RepID=UPI0039A4076E
MKKIASVVVPMLLVFLISSSITYAYGLYGGSWSNPGSLKYWKDQSVTSYGYSSSTDNGLTNWNGVSSKVSISSTSTESSAEIKIYAGDINKDGVYADALNYSRNWLGQVTACWDCNYAASRIRINDPVSKKYNNQRISAVMAHEVGHSLGINHSAVTNALMYESIGSSNEARIWDDNAAIKAIYGN